MCVCIRFSLSRDERICKNCDDGEVKDVGHAHFLLHCAWVAEERRQMQRLMDELWKGI